MPLSESLLIDATLNSDIEYWVMLLKALNLTLIFEEIIIWNFVKYISQCIFSNQCKRIENIGLNFTEDIAPVFVKEPIGCVAQQFIAIVQILIIENDSEM